MTPNFMCLNHLQSSRSLPPCLCPFAPAARLGVPLALCFCVWPVGQPSRLDGVGLAWVSGGAGEAPMWIGPRGRHTSMPQWGHQDNAIARPGRARAGTVNACEMVFQGAARAEAPGVYAG